jgi:UDP-N-acetylglucosamine 2-epimerase
MRREIIRESPDAIFYQGNCMTVPMVVFAAKTVSKKIVLVHRESGIRTNNILEPFLGDLWEKIGDMFGDVLFAPSKVAEENLRKEKLKGKIYNAGDPHVEIVEYALKRGNVKESGQYVVVNVLHFENVTNENKMKNFVEILKRCPFKVIFPMTASVKGRLELFGLMKELEKYPNIVLTDPYNYVDFLKLIEKCEAVLTDSGGVQQESFILKIPCIFLGKINVWKEFEDRGIVISTGFDVKETLRVLDEIKNKGNFYKKVKAAKYPLGDGKATERIVKILERELVG